MSRQCPVRFQTVPFVTKCEITVNSRTKAVKHINLDVIMKFVFKVNKYICNSFVGDSILCQRRKYRSKCMPSVRETFINFTANQFVNTIVHYSKCHKIHPNDPFPHQYMQNVRQNFAVFHSPKTVTRSTFYPFHGGIYNDGHSHGYR